MSFRYNQIQKILKRMYRRFFPVPKSQWTIGEVDDICKINLVPPEKLKNFFLTCFKLLQKINGKDVGDYLEFGVFNGSSISSAYIAAQKMGLKSTRFFGFDAFEGLPKESEDEDDGVWKKGFYACAFQKMKQCIKRKGVNPEEITWVKGWYKNTLNKKTIKKYKIDNVGIIFIDCDTYSSSKSVLDFIKPMITKPIIICLDDWKLNDLDIKGPGEYKSFNEFLEQNPQLIATELRSYNRKSKTFIVQPKK